MNKYICIHGHFYQPPRENPWLEAIENQSSAKPYPNWNERISEECYVANSAARILNGEDKITDIVNNYAKISFNFGPTLLSWVKDKKPELLQALYDADQNSQKNLNGHGNAIAQAYNHMIMPLANTRDKYTQIYWGIIDFERYFHRKPEGMWLPETAVDLETLDIMSEMGIKFTILAPNQVKQIRSLEDDQWHQDFSIGTPYVQSLPSGREITLFIYDGSVAKAVAFEKLLTHGEDFAHRLLDNFPESYTENTLMHIATDGETYGHHHAHGDMGLAYALHYMEQDPEIKLTNYGHFMEIQPAQFAIEIHENSSWSCAHGVERWRSDCGCSAGGIWHQQWREPLRNALDWLRDALIPIFEEQMSELVNDPWEARNQYIKVIHDRTATEEFLTSQAKKELNADEKKTVLKWMELQRHAMLMYTSCGWFFDELSGIETVQVIKYAARVIQLAYELTNEDYESEFVKKLALAPSNIPEYGNGEKIYNMFVKPQRINLFNVSAHLAASLPFSEYEDEIKIYCYKAALQNTRDTTLGKEQLISGTFLVQSEITWETLNIWYAVFYQGDQNLICAIKEPHTGLQEIEDSLHTAFDKGDNFEVVTLFKTHFGDQTISLRDLFYDMKLKITQEILSSVLADLENSEQLFFEKNLTLINFIATLNIELPHTIHNLLNSLLNRDILFYFSKENFHIETLITLFEKAKLFKLDLEQESIAYAANQFLKEQADLLEQQISDKDFVQYLIEIVNFIKSLPIQINLWSLQNKIYNLTKKDHGTQENPLIQELAASLNLEIN